MRAAVAVLRLARAALHLLHGMAIVRWRFEAYSREQREARIAWWSRGLLSHLGMDLVVHGAVPTHLERTLIVANHVSWLDIAAIHAVMPQARFVSKADVQRWPLVGALVAGAGTLFIERERRRDAIRVVHHMVESLDTGEAVAIFPEGTTSDGSGLLPFHANLLQAAVTARAHVLPIVLRFTDAAGVRSLAVTYVGETTLMQSAWRIASAKQTIVRLRALPLLDISGMDRRVASDAAWAAIAQALKGDNDQAGAAR